MTDYNPKEFEQMVSMRSQGELTDFHLANYMKDLTEKGYELADQMLRIGLEEDEYIRARTLATYYRRSRTAIVLAAHQ